MASKIPLPTGTRRLGLRAPARRVKRNAEAETGASGGAITGRVLASNNAVINGPGDGSETAASNIGSKKVRATPTGAVASAEAGARRPDLKAQARAARKARTEARRARATASEATAPANAVNGGGKCIKPTDGRTQHDHENENTTLAGGAGGVNKAVATKSTRRTRSAATRDTRPIWERGTASSRQKSRADPNDSATGDASSTTASTTAATTTTTSTRAKRSQKKRPRTGAASAAPAPSASTSAGPGNKGGTQSGKPRQQRTSAKAARKAATANTKTASTAAPRKGRKDMRGISAIKRNAERLAQENEDLAGQIEAAEADVAAAAAGGTARIEAATAVLASKKAEAESLQARLDAELDALALADRDMEAELAAAQVGDVVVVLLACLFLICLFVYSF